MSLSEQDLPVVTAVRIYPLSTACGEGAANEGNTRGYQAFNQQMRSEEGAAPLRVPGPGWAAPGTRGFADVTSPSGDSPRANSP